MRKQNRRSQSGLFLAWKPLALCGLVAFAAAKAEHRLEGGIRDLRSRLPASSNPIVQKMREHGSATAWAYAEAGIYPFHAQQRVIPELAVVSPQAVLVGAGHNGIYYRSLQAEKSSVHSCAY